MPSTETPLTPTKSSMHWFFDAIAEGLDASTTPSHESATEQRTSALCPQVVAKHVANNALFDANGAPLSAEEAEKASTWRSHHAFGARCGSNNNSMRHVSSEYVQEPAYEDWSVRFHVTAACTDPHVLLSVAPRYFPYAGATSFLPRPEHDDENKRGGSELGGAFAAGMAAENKAHTPAHTRFFLAAHSAEEQDVFDKRMLETPLIYEEPYTLSVECTSKGMFLWSDQWQLYGQRIAEKCMTAPPPLATSGEHAGGAEGTTEAAAARGQEPRQPQQQRREGFVELSWRLPRAEEEGEERQKASLAVSLGTSQRLAGNTSWGKRAARHGGTDVEWTQVFETSLELEDALAGAAAFVPYVTLMEPGESVKIVQ